MLTPGQAQKELNHNEALQQLDIFVGAAVEELPSGAPPVSTALGATFIVGNSPSGEWAGKAECLATWTSGGWRFVAPYEGMTAYVKRTRSHATYRDGAPGSSESSAARQSS
jgi:hypothetical protein